MSDIAQLLASVNWALSLVIAVLLSIVANLLTSPIQNWLARKSTQRAERRVERLRGELVELERLAQSPLDLGLELAALAARVLIFLAFASAITTLASIPERFLSDETSVLLQALGTLCYLISLLLAIKLANTVMPLRYFKAHRERVERMIDSLKRQQP
jgi:hypothetical protein